MNFPRSKRGIAGDLIFEEFIKSNQLQLCGNVFCQDPACKVHDDRYRTMVKELLAGDNSAPWRYLGEQYRTNPPPCQSKPPHTADCDVCGFRQKEKNP